MNNTHPFLAQLHDLLDRRLSPEERDRVEQHLAGCEICRDEWQRLTSTRELLRRPAEDEVPEDVRMRVAAVLEQEVNRRSRLPRIAVGLAAAAALVIMAIVLLRKPHVDLTASVVSDYRSIATGQKQLELRSADTTEMERWFVKRLDFPTRVFDLAMMRYHLVGGRVDSVDGHRSALFVYRHERGAIVVCQMYRGRIEVLPRGLERREHDGITFFIDERNGTTAVFWQEGAVVCVLVSELPRDEVISLAYAKAMKVRI